MADDIVERIRKNLPSIEWEQPLAAERERLAADEIERLRTAGDALADALAWWGKGNDRGDAARVAWQEARRG